MGKFEHSAKGAGPNNFSDYKKDSLYPTGLQRGGTEGPDRKIRELDSELGA